MKTTYSLIALTLIAIGAFVAFKPEQSNASIPTGSSYFGISFAPAQTNTSYKQSYVIDSIQPATTSSVRSSGGTLGSVVITGSASGSFTLYDATTSNATLRASTLATSSLPVLAQFPANASAGTYTLDVYYTKGIVVEFTGTQGTSTITYRPY